MNNLNNLKEKNECFERLGKFSKKAVEAVTNFNESILEMSQDSEISIELFTTVADNLLEAKDILISIEHLSKTESESKEFWVEITDLISEYYFNSNNVYVEFNQHKNDDRITDLTFYKYYEEFQELSFYTSQLLITTKRAISLHINSWDWGI